MKNKYLVVTLGIKLRLKTLFSKMGVVDFRFLFLLGLTFQGKTATELSASNGNVVFFVNVGTPSTSFLPPSMV